VRPFLRGSQGWTYKGRSDKNYQNGGRPPWSRPKSAPSDRIAEKSSRYLLQALSG
jgi:hypothetical protein